MTTATENLAIEYVPIDSVHPDPANPRKISEEELEALTRSITQFKVVQPVLVRAQDRVVIAGHQRQVAARRAGLTEIPVILLSVSKEQARVLGLALNRISGSWDDALLGRMLKELGDLPEVDLRLTGFGEDEIGDFLRGLETRDKRDKPESFDLDEAIEEATRATRAKPGDRWRLGEHLIACGDATKREDVERMLGGRRPAMAFTDPPYNVDLGDHGGQGRDQRRRRLTNDALPQAEWESFVRAWATTLVSVTNGSLYIAMSGKEWPTMCRVLAEVGGHWSTTIIWAKDRFVLGRSDYQRAYEPIWYGWREGGAHHWCGDRDQSDVWQIERPASSRLHPTMKPLELIERAIENSSADGDLVLDLFLGSGSTVIAAERTGRICAGLEIDPVYLDVAIRRWERFSGKVAVLEEAGSGD